LQNIIDAHRTGHGEDAADTGIQYDGHGN
jgi:hypothetical protein